MTLIVIRALELMDGFSVVYLVSGWVAGIEAEPSKAGRSSMVPQVVVEVITKMCFQRMV